MRHQKRNGVPDTRIHPASSNSRNSGSWLPLSLVWCSTIWAVVGSQGNSSTLWTQDVAPDWQFPSTVHVAGLLLAPPGPDVFDEGLLPRRLADVTAKPGWDFLLGTTLSAKTLLEDRVFGSGAAASLGITLLAGLRYSALTITMPVGYEFGISHQIPVVKLVDGSAEVGDCGLSTYNVPMAITRADAAGQTFAVSPLASGNVLSLGPLRRSATATTVLPHLTFMRGGVYKLCYNPMGSFSGEYANLNTFVPVLVTVTGVRSPCSSNGCLETEAWDCYYSYRAEVAGPCRVDLRTFGGGRPSWTVTAFDVSRISWTSAWEQDSYVAGRFVLASPQRCSDTLGLVMSPETRRFQPFSWQPATGSGLNADARTAASLPTPLPEMANTSLTLTVCYCPNYDGPEDSTPNACDHPSEFIQPIGQVRYWMLRICDTTRFQSCGVSSPPYMRILPQQPFVLRLQCPPGGACSGVDNKLRLLPSSEPGSDPELPAWDPLSRCRTAKVEEEAPGLMWMLPDGSDNTTAPTGGARRDYRVWSDSFLLAAMPMDTSFDVCYCDSRCEDRANFFAVGQIRVAEYMSVARWTMSTFVRGPIDPIETVQYVSKAGSITFYGGVASAMEEGMLPWDSVPFTRSALLKLIPFDGDSLGSWSGNVTLEEFSGLHKSDEPARHRVLDAACKQMGYMPSLVAGPSSIENAKEFKAFASADNPSKYLTFSGRANDQSMIVRKAGVLVVCYCAMLMDTDYCMQDSYWTAAVRILISGPAGGVSIFRPTGFVVRLELEGWGFSSQDTLRFVLPTQACSENANSPSGVTTFRLGCPGVNASDCRPASTSEDIVTMVDSANSTGVFILNIDIGEYNSTLTFTSSITDILKDGDAITIEDSSILLAGNDKSTWTIAEQHTVSRLAGFYRYADDAAARRTLWTRVAYVPLDGGGFHPRKLTVPVGWPEAQRPDISFTDPGGIWVRRNRLQTREELKSEVATTFRVCWAPRDGGRQRYYADAGTVTFQEPPRMDDAGVHLTSWARGSVAPVVIAFSPRRNLPAYRDFTMPIVLRLLFRGTNLALKPLLPGTLGSNLSILDPDLEVPAANASQAVCGQLFSEMWTNDAGGFPLPTGCYFSREYQDVTVPGQLPSTYREYFITWDVKQGLKSQCFDARFSRRGSCAYQLVVNALVGDIPTTTTELVGIYTYCGGTGGIASSCGPAYSIIEYGRGTSRQISRSSNASTSTLLDRVDLDTWETFGAGGRGWGHLQLSASTVISGREFFNVVIRAWPASPDRPIRRQAHLRLFLLPLTMWDLGLGDCRAVCVPPANLSCSDGRGGSFPPCLRQAVVNTPYDSQVRMQRNSIDLEYPRAMDTIPLNRSNETHVLKLEALALPSQGFFSLRLLVQLAGKDGSAPSSALVSGSISRVPMAGATSGRLLVTGQTGSGPRPFGGDIWNQIVVRLSLGATLWRPGAPAASTSAASASAASDSASSSASAGLAAPQVSVQLPPGYTCSIQGSGLADPDRELEIFSVDQDANGYVDNFMGTLRNGVWTSDGRTCTFTLEPGAAIFVGQVWYVRFAINNPMIGLLRDDPLNLWLIDVQGSNSTPLGTQVPFIALAEERRFPGWAGNLAVVTPVVYATLQPTLFVAGAANRLEVFFSTSHQMPNRSYVVLDAPVGFDFGSSCTVTELSDAYYADWDTLAWGEDLSGDRSLTRSLGAGTNCTGEQWERSPLAAVPTANFTRARILLPRSLEMGSYYGFAIEVLNAKSYATVQHDNWRLWILGPSGYMVDGTRDPLQFNAARVNTLPQQPYDRAWGTYAESLLLPLTMNFGAASLLPSALMQMSATVTVFPLAVTRDGSLVSIRIMAPMGYEWDVFSTNGFIGSVPNATCPLCRLYATPLVLEKNELILSDLVMAVGQSYGFQARIKVPSRAPTRSANAFFVEIGYDSADPTWRMQASRLPPPDLRVIRDAKVQMLSDAVGYAQNVVEFHLRTASDMHANDGFVFRGDGLTRGIHFVCWPWPETVKGPALLSSTMDCSTFADEVTGLPVLILRLVNGRLPATDYGIRFSNVRNPLDVQTSGGSWTIGTYSGVDEYPKLRVLDQAVSAPASRTREQIWDAGLLKLSDWDAGALGRDDRPLAENHLAFYFQLYRALSLPSGADPSIIVLRGPPGFDFAADCLDSVRPFGLGLANSTNASSASDPLSRSWWPCNDGDNVRPGCPGQIEVWPWDITPFKCQGFANTAKLQVANLKPQRGPDNASTFTPKLFYAFQIGVTNPPVAPDLPLWAINVGSEASLPFSSFSLRGFGEGGTNFTSLARFVASPFASMIKGYPVVVLFVPTVLIPPIRPDGGAGDSSGVLRPLAPDAEEGRLVLAAPEGFVFVDATTRQCSSFILERMGRMPDDQTGLFRDGTDVTCQVGQPNQLAVRLTGSKALAPRTAYRLVALVRNPLAPAPPSTWVLTMYKSFVATSQLVPLDQAKFPFPSIVRPLSRFFVDNEAQELGGDAKVRSVRLTMQFAGGLLSNDSIKVISPRGLNIRAGASLGLGECADFRWPDQLLPLPNSPPPVCYCGPEAIGGVSCWLRIDVREGAPGVVVLAENLDFVFLISAINPAGPATVYENYWRVEQTWWDGTAKAAGTVAGWTVYGQMRNVSIVIASPPTRAGTTTDLVLQFTPAVFGSVLQVLMDSPSGFDFSATRPNAPLVRDVRTQGNVLVLSGGRFQADQLSTLTLGGVRLGNGGGQTRMTLRLYSSTRMDQEVARRINFVRGFRLPGALGVLEQRLWSAAVVKSYEGTEPDEVQPFLLSHDTELQRVELLLNVTKDVLPGESLVIRSITGKTDSPYAPTLEEGFRPTLVLCSGVGGGVGNSQLPSSCQPTGPVTVDTMSLLRSEGVLMGLNLTFGGLGSNIPAMQVGRVYRLRFWALTSLSTTYWELSTFDGGESPTNTNDGATQAIRTVSNMGVLVEPYARRCPPQSLVVVRLTVQAGAKQTDISELHVALPVGFLPGSMRRQVAEPGRSRLILKLDLTAGRGSLQTGLAFDLLIFTPPQTAESSDLRWLVLAYVRLADEFGTKGAGEALMTGWGLGDGFRVAAMPMRLSYAAIQAFTGWISFTLSVPSLVLGKFVLVTAPQGVALLCPPDGTNQPSLPCYSFNPATVKGGILSTLVRTTNISLTGGVLEGDNMLYSFLLGLRTSNDMADNMTWDIRVLNADFDTVDSALSVSGPPNRGTVYVENPSLSWDTQPQEGEISGVTVEVSFSRRVKGVKALLISLPEGYRHAILFPNQLKSVNKLFPVLIDQEWRRFQNLRWIQILLEAVDQLPSGTFQFKFPVMVPTTMPLAREWYLSMCFSWTCSSPDGSDVMVTFPIPDPSPVIPAKVFGSGLIATQAAAEGHGPGCALLLALLTVLASRVL